MARRDLDEWLWQVGVELQRLSEEIGVAGPQLAKSRGWQPRVDLIETEQHVVLRAELAGVRGDDIRISFNSERNSIILRGVRHPHETPNPCRGAHLLEIHYGEFEREIPLPAVPLDIDAMEANYRNGFLSVAVPKQDASTSAVEVTRITVRRS